MFYYDRVSVANKEFVTITWLPHCQECQENQEKSGKTTKKDKSPEKSGENKGFRKNVMKSQEI